MQTQFQKSLRSYGIALVATTGFALLRLALDPVLGERTPLFLQILPVAVAAWSGGWTAGVAATLLNAFVGVWLFIPPRFQLLPMDLIEQVRTAVFIGTGVLISQLYESLHHARRAVMKQAAEQKQLMTESQLWRSRYEAAIKASGCVLYDSNRETGEVVYGGGCEAILGYTADELNGNVSKWVEHIHPEDRPVFLHELNRTNRSRLPYSADYRMLRRDGQMVWMRDDGHFAQEEDGKPAARIIGFVKDVTEHRQTEMERVRMAERLTLLTDHTPLSVIEWNADFVITRWSGQAEKIFGWTAEEVLGRHFDDFPFVHPDDAHLVQKAVDELCRPSILHCVNENRNLTKSGQVVSSVWYNSVLYDSRGQVESVLSLVLDVTERERSEAELRRSEERFRQLANAMPQVVWIADKDGQVNYYNSRVADLSGVTETPDGMWTWLPVLHPEDQQATADNWRHAVRTGTPYEHEHRIRMIDGTYRWHLSRGLPTLSRGSGEIIWFGTATDVHDLKVSQNALRENEATLRGVYETSPLLMGVVELAESDILHIYDNPATCRFLNVEFGATSGCWTRELGTPETVIENWISQFRTSERTQAPVEFRSIHHTAMGERQLSVTVSSLGCSASGQTRFCYVAEDVTERIRDEQELRDAHRRKDEFLATLAHELRNPLAPIRTGLEVLRMANGDADLISQVRQTMERQTQQLITLVDDLLDVSRITQGRLELRKCRFVLSDVVQSAIEASRPCIDESGHELTVSFPEHLLSVEADPNRLAQVISNLLNNAAKYTPEGGHIHLKVERRASEIVIAVKDNGIGVAPDMQRQIFEMFAQISDRPLERGFRGLGIGLTLVRSLVEMHGGRIEVHSDGVNQGSEFVVSLPANSDGSPEASPPDPIHAEMALPSGRVLVVDDNKEAATTLAMLVRMLGSDVRTAHDGEEAIRLAGDFLPELILMDIGMPRMNGYDAATLIRQQPWGRRMMLVALTGWGQEEDKQRSRKAGFDDHLVKPAEPSQLQRLLTNAHIRPAQQ